EEARLLAGRRGVPGRAEERTQADSGPFAECLLPRGRLIGRDRSRRRFLSNGPDLLDHAAFHRRCRQRRRRTCVPAAAAGVQADVVAIAQAAVASAVRGRHGAAAGPAVQQALEQRPEPIPHRRTARAAILTQALLYPLPDFRLDDGRLLAGVHLGLMADLA